MTRVQDLDPDSLDDLPLADEEKRAYVLQMMRAVIDMELKGDRNVKQARIIAFTSIKALQTMCWDFLACIISAHMGEPNVFPWAASFYYKKYNTFDTKWNEAIELFQFPKRPPPTYLHIPTHNGLLANRMPSAAKKTNNDHNEHKAQKTTAVESIVAIFISPKNAISEQAQISPSVGLPQANVPNIAHTPSRQEIVAKRRQRLAKKRKDRLLLLNGRAAIGVYSYRGCNTSEVTESAMGTQGPVTQQNGYLHSYNSGTFGNMGGSGNPSGTGKRARDDLDDEYDERPPT
ncbi:hypothetical protein B0T20DRAFT_391234 [Sordaria brevicollis]|uniref:Uncharacterized protein n=1 Tax=Sordaria brevicollis TaxID=83679 RepID=A0AAE0PGV5_SORBR|nr:hypothetical protein B0T20DRAFT_391234 [Sordaria brevicollis]